LPLGPQLKIPVTGEVPVEATKLAPRDEQLRQVNTSACVGVLLSVAFTLNDSVDPTLTVSFPGIIRTGGILCEPAGYTVIRMIALELSSSSDTLKVTLYCPTCEEKGVQLKVPVTWPGPLVEGKLAPTGQFRHDKTRFGGGVLESEALILKDNEYSAITLRPVGA
jgi:hypothetical protein